MSLLFFIVHSLGFYIYWGAELGFKSDGQLAFGVINSFPTSSWAFIIIGLTIDIIKNFRFKISGLSNTNNITQADHYN